MFNPATTYRLQFHKDFTFESFEKIIPYLKQLGISTVYASPIFESVPGSIHGYDGVNPKNINPEIGTLEQLKTISQKLKAAGIGWLQDIVPNHMAYHQNNAWLMDVLEKGTASPYASFFDIVWNDSPEQTKLMVPFLGDTIYDVINKKELKVVYSHGKFAFSYFDSIFPLAYTSYTRIINAGNQNEGVKALLLQLFRENESGAFQQQLAGMTADNTIKDYIDACLQAVNENIRVIEEIADEQYYRLCQWQETDTQINYRRFFTINGLICLNIQDRNVFDHYHALIKSLVEEQVFQGLRIDHIDGLHDPTSYLYNLREITGDEVYITAEKILEPKEALPESWPIQGTTGYDFLAMVNNLFTDSKSEKEITNLYKDIVKNKKSLHHQLRDKKALILYKHMNGELQNLYELFKKLKLADEAAVSFINPDTFKKAIGEFLVRCPVYRYYGNRMPLDIQQKIEVAHILKKVKENNKALAAAVEMLEGALLKDEADDNAIQFYQRCMQFTGPLMAKGVEDTLMYTYNRFIAHNEVGDSPGLFGFSVPEFHALMQDRQQKWPYALNATATHDTKRGEDVRARLNVLTDLGNEWIETVQQWQLMNASLKQNGAPDANDEYLIYQSLTGCYLMPGQPEDNFTSRFQAYVQKALREAKVHTDWAAPDEEYEKNVNAFIAALFDTNNPFWLSFQAFQSQISDAGIINSLSQVLLKFTCPGIPDVYQGCELWDLSMVDPDNRRAVNYEQRMQWLEELNHEMDNPALPGKLWEERNNGKIKLWLTNILSEVRREAKDFFVNAHYLPLQIEGKYKENILAFARQYSDTWYIIAVPLHLTAIARQQACNLVSIDWKDTCIVLPPEAPLEWQDIHSNTISGKNKVINANSAFNGLPLMILQNRTVKNTRGAGILLPVFSLASPFGMGDFGPGAKAFADFLYRSGQKYWQLLPLNPTAAKNAHSPYSSISSMAGNPLLISPELLAEEGLLHRGGLKQHYLAPADKVDYASAEKIKKILFEEAYNTFTTGDFLSLKYQFTNFCKVQAYWLDDFALYAVIKNNFEDAPWFQWPDEYKNRDREVLSQFAKEHDRELHKVKWLQFITDIQWKSIKAYCNSLNIQLLGDVPFYVSYDSVDVWANQGIFCLGKDGAMTGIAGVPPDYFSETGQLWGMPTYNWNALKEHNYEWWISRLRKNLELFDLVRLDHFRAFAEYWQVPAGEKDAVHGEWITGPGIDFFNTARKQIGGLPIVAEDLGDNMEKVYQLRDEVKLPGMKVLQFAWGENMPCSVDIPHNYPLHCIAYTGTHDNNTTAGWYKEETKKADHKRMEQYLGKQVDKKSIHKILARIVYASVAQTAIIPMQDILGLDEKARMNTPGSNNNNWLWRMPEKSLSSKIEKDLRSLIELYNRK